MHRVRKQHRLVVAQRIEKLLIAFDEGFLLRFVEPARNHLRLVVFQAQTM
jgi:hypothetical protein